MSKIEITDEFLYQHMPSYEEKVLDAMPKEDEIDYEFSEEFEKKMEVLIRRAKQKEKYHLPVKTWQRVAAAIVIVFVAVMTITLSAKAVRKKLFDFIKNVYPTYTTTTYYSDEEIVGEFRTLYPEYIPDGYELVTEDGGIIYLTLEYRKGEGENISSILISQEQITDGMVVENNYKYVKEKKCKIRGNEAKLCYKENGTIKALWEEKGCLYMVSVTDLSKRELIKICESLN